MLLAVVIVGAIGSTYLLLLTITARRSDAGIPTSRLGRGLRFGGASLAMGLRSVPNAIRRWMTPRRRRDALRRQQRERAALRAVETMGSMKGVLMKLGQVMSFMDDALPETYLQTLRSLQSQAPSMGTDLVRTVIAEELGAQPEQLFTRFDAAPIASASIGQVPNIDNQKMCRTDTGE